MLRGSSFWRFLEDPTLSMPSSWRRIQCSPCQCCPSLVCWGPVSHPCRRCSQPLLEARTPRAGAPGCAVLLPGRPVRIWALPPTPTPSSAWLGSGATGSTGSARMRRATAPVAGPRPAGTSGSIHGAGWDFPLGISAELCGAAPCIPPVLPQLLLKKSFPVFCNFFPLFAFIGEASEGLGWFCHQHKEPPLARPPKTIPHHPPIAWKQGRRIQIFFHIF